MGTGMAFWDKDRSSFMPNEPRRDFQAKYRVIDLKKQKGLSRIDMLKNQM